jgi:hypothetical protein
MKNRHFGLIGSLLILTVFFSCVSLTDKTASFNGGERLEIIGNVRTTFTTYQFLHIIGKKHKIKIMKKAYSRLLAEAQYEYGTGIDVINIVIEGTFSGHNFWFLPAYGFTPIFSNFQQITATGNVINLGYQGQVSVNRSNTMENQNNPQRQSRGSSQPRETDSVPQLGVANLLQQSLNRMPAIPIAGKNLKFEFGGDRWFAKVNGANFLAGDCIFEETGNGSILTLRTTNVWSGSVEEVIDLFQRVGVPLGAAAGSLRAAARLAARLAKWIPFNGSPIILEYNEGPPASLQYSNK